MADTPDITGTTQAGGQVPNVSGPAYEDTVQQDRQALADAHRRNVQLGLLAAGLGVLSYRQPWYERGGGLGRALGQGGLMGLSTYEEGESSAERELLARQNARALQAYRMGELDVRRQGVQEQGRRTDVMAGAQQEKAQHDIATEQLTQQQRDIAAANAAANQSRAGSEAARVGIENAKLGIEQTKQQPLGGPTATSLLTAYKVPGAKELGTAVGALPRDLAMRAINTAVMANKQNLKPQHYVDDKNILHVYATAPDGSKAFDTIIGPVQPKGKGKGSLADEFKADAAAAAGEATPTSASTPATNPTPTATPAPTKEAGLGERVGLVDADKYKNGTYTAKDGTRYRVKDGVLYKLKS